jgi:hypothetical protein
MVTDNALCISEFLRVEENVLPLNLKLSVSVNLGQSMTFTPSVMCLVLFVCLVLVFLKQSFPM